MTNKNKVKELLVHYLHTIPEAGEASEVEEIVDMIYADIASVLTILAETAKKVDLYLYRLWALAFVVAVLALYRTF